MTKYKKDKSIITIDIKKYEHLLEETDWSDEQKEEFLQTIWNIVWSFVSFGFSVHPLNQIEFVCGKTSKQASETSSLPDDLLKYINHQLSNEFEDKTTFEEKCSEKESCNDTK